MYDWLPDLCRELRGNLVAVYWLLIIPLVTLLCILEYFKLPEGNPDIPNIIKRAILSMMLLLSFNETLHMISFVGDGIVDHVGGMNNIQLVLKSMWGVLSKTEVSWVHYRELFIFFCSILSYIAAYLGAFIADALVHFCWAVLYIVSPLMILAYIPVGTSGACKSLYRSLCTVMCWKILWAILGAMLLHLSTSAPVTTTGTFTENQYNAVLIVVMNLFIGASMLFVPFATKSIINDGLAGFASGLAAIPAAAAQKVLIMQAKRVMVGGARVTGRAVGASARWTGEKMGLVEAAARSGRRTWRESGRMIEPPPKPNYAQRNDIEK